jgi:putative selenate reductase molybdopterin-binding subunit
MLLPEATEVAVAFTCDGVAYQIDVPSDLSALRAIREIAGHERPRRGCEAGICGKCESLVDGIETRLCQLPAPSLDGIDIVTPAPRKSMWAV